MSRRAAPEQSSTPPRPPSVRPPNRKPAAATLRRVEVASRADWRAWLRTHHLETVGVWLVYKKASRGGALSMDDIVEEALCFGWIDSLPRSLDDDRTMLMISPRKPKSNWSAVNKARVERMQAARLMAPRGAAVVEAAKASGTWEALNGVDALEVPADLLKAFERYDEAARHFAAFPPSAKRGILEWILNAKQPSTREKRVDETARLAAQNVRANQWRKT